MNLKASTGLLRDCEIFANLRLKLYSAASPLTKPDGFSSVLILLLIKSEIWELEQQHLVYCINKLDFLPLFHRKVDPNIYTLDIIAARGWHWW